MIPPGTMSKTARAVLFGLAMIAGVALAPGARAQELRLLMISQVGCHVCETFLREVAPKYEQAPEQRIAPLIHADIRGPLPEGVTLASRPFVTPTFILIGPDGQELDRLTGFPGEDFFWPYIDEMIARAQTRLSSGGAGTGGAEDTSGGTAPAAASG